MFSFSFFVLLMAVSLATINVNGIAEAPKRAKVFQVIMIFFFCKKLISPAPHKVRSGKVNGGVRPRGPPARTDRRV